MFKYPTLTYAAIYTIVALIGLFLFFYACNILAARPGVVPEIELVERVAHAAYAGSTVPIQYTPECGRYNEQVTYLLRPGRCRFERPEYDTPIEANSFGLRDDEESLDRPEILVLGDSHAMGLGVAARDAFPSLVESALGRKTLDAGISSFGTAREMMLLQILDAYFDLSDLDYIILQYCQNDVGKNIKYTRADGDLDILSHEEYQDLVRRIHLESDSFLVPGLVVFRRTTDKIWELLTGPGKAAATMQEADAFHYAVEANKELLGDKHLIILDINDHNTNNWNFIESARARFKDSELNVHFIRTSDFLTDEDYYTLDPHMLPSGHRKVADAIIKVIERIETSYTTALESRWLPPVAN